MNEDVWGVPPNVEGDLNKGVLLLEKSQVPCAAP